MFLQTQHVFDRSGLCSLSELRTGQWEDVFQVLEEEQRLFLEKEPLFRSPGYQWPRDALHTWSRAWEYPYVYHHLQEYRDAHGTGHPLRVVDLGSGVTFFPFAVAKIGYHVTCVDVDPVLDTDLRRAIESVPAEPGTVDYRLTDGSSLPFDDGQVDAIYCVSVIEHIPDFQSQVREMGRVLRPNGLLVLSFDVDLRGNYQLGPHEFHQLTESLREDFDPIHPETTVHPSDLLTTEGGLYPMRFPRGPRLLWRLGKEWIAKPLLNRKPCAVQRLHLAVYTTALNRKQAERSCR